MSAVPLRRRTNPKSAVYNGRRASLKLQFVVVGGGLTGLATACALSQAGHKVLVLEASDGFYKYSGGMCIPPNFCRMLYEWGLGPRIQEIGIVQVGATFRDFGTDEGIGYMKWAEEVLEELGADFPVMSHADLYRTLYETAIKLGARVRFGARATHVDAETPSVTLQSGEVLRADYIIGADGHRSIVRNTVFAGSSKPFRGTKGLLIHTGNVPAHLMESDPELRKLLDYDGVVMWMGDNFHITGSPSARRKEYAIHIYKVDDEFPEVFYEKFDEPFKLPSLRRVMEGAGPVISKVVDMLPWVLRSKDVERPHEEEWISDSGRVALIGSAAHPSLPTMVQDAAMGMEDAVVLGNLFSRLRNESQIPIFFNAYQELRQQRCLDARFNDMGTAGTLWFPPGPAREARNAAMRLAAAAGSDGKFDDSVCLEQWEQCKDMFNYNANDEAEAWFAEWGVLYERSAAASNHVRTPGAMSLTSISMQVDVQVAVSE